MQTDTIVLPVKRTGLDRLPVGLLKLVFCVKVVFKWKTLFKCAQFQLNDCRGAEEKITRLRFVLNFEKIKIKQTNKTKIHQTSKPKGYCTFCWKFMIERATEKEKEREQNTA